MDRCEYCQMHQSLQGATFHLEHAVPRSAGGTDELDNLALACPSCNLHKADRTKIQVAGFEEQENNKTILNFPVPKVSCRKPVATAAKRK